jgi:ribonuclease P protein component
MESFPKENRLLSRGDFSYLKSKSKKIVQKSLIAYVKPTQIQEKAISRLGISASRKFGKANKRNLFKRLIRESFRKSDFKSMGYDLLIVANNKLLKKDEKISESTKVEIRNNLDFVLKKMMEI